MPAMAKNAPAAAAANHTPNDALARDVMVAAHVIARVWPRPHAPYFEADRPRRLLIAWLAASWTFGPNDGEALATWSLRRLVAHYAPLAPQGLVEALKRAEDRPWRPDEMAMLIALLSEGGEGQKTLRHAAVITPRLVATLAALPQPLRRARIAAQLGHREPANLVHRALKHCWGKAPDPAALRRLAQRLDRAPSQHTLFGWLVEELGLARLAPPPVPGTAWLRPILGVTDIERTALKFQNCLRGRIPAMLRGLAAYFEVVGDEGAVVELLMGNGVWAIGEIRGMANADTTRALRAKIVGYLEGCGAIKKPGAPGRLAIELADAAGW